MNRTKQQEAEQLAQEELAMLRHSCAHLLAQAVKSLFPEAKLAIGPVIDDGFYYDFDYVRSFTPEDLTIIEQKMHELAKLAQPIIREEVTKAEAYNIFNKKHEFYKLELLAAIPDDEIVTLYSQGDFVDLCRGPHVANTKQLKVFKLMKIAGAYWRGDAKNAMLQRIYGTAWATKTDLDQYLQRIEEAEKRDHRKLIKKYDLCHLQDEAPGMAFWHPKGLTIYQIIENYIREINNCYGYYEVRTPQLIERILWEQSGHWDKFQDTMFTLISDERHFALKPMNCPGHIQIYNQGIKSYRDLPLRFAEFGICHRYEPSGSLHGLMRLRSFMQDDGHVFCTEDQIQTEIAKMISILFAVYANFGFTNIIIRVSTRPEKRVGSDEVWDKAEQALIEALTTANLAYEINPGEGAFYGPKIEFSLKDCLNRVWQCGTVQVDFSMTERLDCHYIAEDGSKIRPVLLHRAILGSLERFIGVLLEETAGSLPVWLMPEQVAVLTITDAAANWAQEISQNLRKLNFRVTEDLRNEKIGFKIRNHAMQRVPFLLVVGGREAETRTIAVRTRDGVDLGVMSLSEFTEKLSLEVAKRGRKGY